MRVARRRDRHGHLHDSGGGGSPGRDGEGGVAGTSSDGRIDGTDQSFTAVGSAFKGALNWSLISRLSRSQWEKSMASCCLGGWEGRGGRGGAGCVGGTRAAHCPGTKGSSGCCCPSGCDGAGAGAGKVLQPWP